MSQNSLSFKNIRGGEGRGDIKRERGGAGGGGVAFKKYYPEKCGGLVEREGHNGGFTVHGF